MFSHASKTVRVNDVSMETKKSTLEVFAETYCKTHGGRKWLCGCFAAARRIGGNPIVSLAPQRGGQTGTISFPSEELKNSVLKTDRTWRLDDDFNGLTVLWSAAEAKVE
jgi:hypothetical protein